MTNALSFDIEEWYHVEALHGFQVERISQVVQATTIILDLLKRYQTHATMFVVGEVAEAYPQLIERMLKEGHELGFHGWTHQPLWRLTPESFGAEVEQFLAWRDAHFSGVPINGFRAPTFSLDQTTAWAIPILREHGFQYDSSIFPAQTPLYGVPNAPTKPYFIHEKDLALPIDSGLLEIPMSVFPILGRRIGFTGGLYLRALPWPVVRWMIQRQQCVVTYIHPWEVYPQTPRLSLSRWQRFILYSGLPVTPKLEDLLSGFQWDTLEAIFMPSRELAHDR